MVTQKMSALQPGLGGENTTQRGRGGSRREGRGGEGRGDFISAWQIFLNSKRTANTLSGTDSSHLVKKLWSQVLLETERKKIYIDKKRWRWVAVAVFGRRNVCVFFVCVCLRNCTAC